tara:strand:- start:16519 stop:17568 length:1050 start_codon:yes stop_codon:yes gene_type:complete
MITEDITPRKDPHENSDINQTLLATIIGWGFMISFGVLWIPCWLLYKLVYIAIPAGLVAGAVATKMGHGKLVHDSVLPFVLLTGLGLFLRFYIYAINLKTVDELFCEDAIEEEERRKQEIKKDVKKLLEKKWFKWVSRSFTVIWLFMGCLVFHFSEGGIIRTGSQGYWITVVWVIGMFPMILIVGLITYPCQGNSRGSSGRNKGLMNKRRIIWERVELIIKVISIIFCVSLFVVFCGAMGLKMGGPIAAAIAGLSALAIMVTGIVVIFKQHKEESEVEEKNKTKAAKLFRKSAEQGHVSAQFNLGVMYETGQGVPEDKAEAIKWIRKAAEQGDEDAKTWLGINTKENGE